MEGNINIGVVGLGLMGGSLALSLTRKGGGRFNVVGVTQDEAALASALRDGAIASGGCGNYAVLSDCDLVFICVPVTKICETAGAMAPCLKPGCIVTDVGSVKGGICAEMERMINSGELRSDFVGGHPMTGSEKSGYAAASETLFENACYILIGDEEDKPAQAVRAVIEAIGAIPVFIKSAAEHDTIVARISHVPHIVAAALSLTIKDEADESARRLAAGGFRSLTRVAGGDPALWAGIIAQNAQAIIQGLERFHSEINELEARIRGGGTAENALASAKEARDRLPSRVMWRDEIYILRVEVKDAPGELANIAGLLYNNQINIKNVGIVTDREHSHGQMSIELENVAAKDGAAKALSSAGYVVK